MAGLPGPIDFGPREFQADFWPNAAQGNLARAI